MRKPYTADRAYRLSVLPLGIFMVLAGIAGPAWAVFAPVHSFWTFVPEPTNPLVKRLVLGGTSLPLLPLGIGVCLRSKLAWWGFFAWMATRCWCFTIAPFAAVPHLNRSESCSLPTFLRPKKNDWQDC